MKYLTLLVLVGLSACASPAIERLAVPDLEPVCYQLICTE